MSWQPPSDQPSGWQPPERPDQPPQPPPSPWGQPQPGTWPPPQQPQWGAPPPPSSGKATAALICGIAGFLVCPLVLSIVALVLGYQARTEIDQSQGRIGGRGMAVAAIWLGWIGIAVGILAIIGLALILATVDTTTIDSGSDFY